MRRTTMVAAITVIVAFLPSPAARADDVTGCAAIQGKAFAKMNETFLKEAARACGKGAAGAPLPARRKVVGAALGKALKAVGTGLDRFGSDNCVLDLTTLVEGDFGALVDGLAASACQVP